MISIIMFLSTMAATCIRWINILIVAAEMSFSAVRIAVEGVKKRSQKLEAGNQRDRRQKLHFRAQKRIRANAAVYLELSSAFVCASNCNCNCFVCIHKQRLQVLAHICLCVPACRLCVCVCVCVWE